MKNRDKAVSIMKNWLEMPTPAHDTVVVGYNSRLPLPRGYALKMGDAWCAATVSEALSRVCPENSYREVSAHKLFQLMRTAFGVEPDAQYIKPGDIVFYDWDNNGVKDHVGMVVEVTHDTATEPATVTVIEGNLSGKMGKRKFKAGEKVCGAYPEYIPFMYPDEYTEALQKRWYDDVMKWGLEKGLITEERPNDPITRAEMLTILKRFYANMI